MLVVPLPPTGARNWQVWAWTSAGAARVAPEAKIPAIAALSRLGRMNLQKLPAILAGLPYQYTPAMTPPAGHDPATSRG